MPAGSPTPRLRSSLVASSLLVATLVTAPPAALAGDDTPPLLAPVVSPGLKGQVDGLAAEVEAREIAFAKTMADRDFEAFKTFLSPEVVTFSGNEPVRGLDAVSQAWAANFADSVAPFSWHPDLVQVLESGRLALSSGPVRNPAGEEVGRFNSIWRKDADGQWRVVFEKGS
jgi:ketosteroid isomerase-like protein